MQDLPAPKSKWRALQGSKQFQSQNVRIYGDVFHDTNGQNHDQTLKTPLFLLNEICLVTHLTDCGKENLKISIGTERRVSTELEMPIRPSKTRSIPIRRRG